MKKQTLIILAIMLTVVVVVSAGVGIYAWIYGNIDRSEALDDDQLLEYNVLLTAYARSAEKISTSEVIVIHSMHKEVGKDTVAHFYVYQLADGETDGDILKLSSEQIEADGSHALMATGSATLVNDAISNIQDLSVLYVR